MRRGPRGFEPAPEHLAGHVAGLLARMPELDDPELPSFELVEFEPLLDSADMEPKDWERIARAVQQRYEAFDGFAVLHGTDTMADTMAYTASALSFLLDGLAKPVVLTGARIPIAEVPIAALRPFPGVRSDLLCTLLAAPVAGLVLETYVSGNAPQRDAALFEVLRDATARGTVIVNCTQCLRGELSARATRRRATGGMLAPWKPSRSPSNAPSATP